MFARILILFLVAPIVELALLIQLGSAIGFWPTLGLIVATAVLGSILLKREGLAVWKRFTARLNEGGLPGKELVDGVIILLAGALLVTPGVLSDVVGIAGLLPVSRPLIRRFVMDRVRKKLAGGDMAVSFFSFRSDEQPASDESAWRGRPAESPRHTQDSNDLGRLP